ncbi:DUF1294 domain-containing protein [Marinicrinis lubricantis]|uniref:DUF1294 domain-containing protein n=1 Tax=Marinicrinis lubricantis TaxID=2086470 RepID=A0ABW1IMB9_9BACL
MNIIQILIIYYSAMNLIGLWLMKSDKVRAVRKQRRIPEKRLFTIAALGGAAGCWLGMRMFRHKTKHRSFIIGIPLLVLINVLCIYGLYTWVL